MSMLLLGYTLGNLTAMLYNHFVVKPKIKAMVDLLEQRRLVAKMENDD